MAYQKLHAKEEVELEEQTAPIENEILPRVIFNMVMQYFNQEELGALAISPAGQKFLSSFSSLPEEDILTLAKTAQAKYYLDTITYLGSIRPNKSVYKKGISMAAVLLVIGIASLTTGNIKFADLQEEFQTNLADSYEDGNAIYAGEKNNCTAYRTIQEWVDFPGGPEEVGALVPVCQVYVTSAPITCITDCSSFDKYFTDCHGSEGIDMLAFANPSCPRISYDAISNCNTNYRLICSKVEETRLALKRNEDSRRYYNAAMSTVILILGILELVWFCKKCNVNNYKLLEYPNNQDIASVLARVEEEGATTIGQAKALIHSKLDEQTTGEKSQLIAVGFFSSSWQNNDSKPKQIENSPVEKAEEQQVEVVVQPGFVS